MRAGHKTGREWSRSVEGPSVVRVFTTDWLFKSRWVQNRGHFLGNSHNLRSKTVHREVFADAGHAALFAGTHSQNRFPVVTRQRTIPPHTLMVTIIVLPGVYLRTMTQQKFDDAHVAPRRGQRQGGVVGHVAVFLVRSTLQEKLYNFLQRSRDTIKNRLQSGIHNDDDVHAMKNSQSKLNKLFLRRTPIHTRRPPEQAKDSGVSLVRSDCASMSALLWRRMDTTPTWPAVAAKMRGVKPEEQNAKLLQAFLLQRTSS